MTLKNLLDVITVDRTLPEGTDMWAIKTTRPDLRTRHDYRWPYPGQWATAPGPIVRNNLSPCPTWNGDGICVTTTWAGMASGNIPASTLLLCAINTSDILGQDANLGKLRVARAYVVDLIDGERLIREHGNHANLRGANLRYMELQGANLQGADLAYADMYGALLYGADLYLASLQGADLRKAYLYQAYLHGANLYGALLDGANLKGANLQDTNLCDVDLRGAVLTPKQRAYAKKQGAEL